MIWIGIVIGGFIGMLLGILIMAAVVAGHNADMRLEAAARKMEETE